MKKIFTFTIIIILVASFIGTGYFLYKKSEKPAEVYETEKPFVTNIIKKTVATGSIVPRKEIEVKSQVSGVVEKLYVEAGEKVTSGQLIAKIKIIPDVVALNNAESSLNRARINFNNAERELNRQQQLFKEKVISEVEFNEFLLDYNLRKQELEAAENNLELVKEGASKKSGNVSNLVHSTVDGMVLDVPVEEGDFVIETNTFNDGTTIAAVADMNEMIFEGKVDESEVGKIKEGMDLNLKVGAIENETFYAQLEYIAPKGVEEEGAIQFEIKAAINLNQDFFLRAGYSANADIVLDKRDSVLAIKESNLIFENDTTYVEVEVADQQFEKKQVKTGLSDGINIEVVEGVSKDDKLKKM
ncbi:MAG: efflux RND transporter periplasmic adaptor subunit [Candidatus Cyclobacteriaceae bacterium M3_2C_046]